VYGNRAEPLAWVSEATAWIATAGSGSMGTLFTRALPTAPPPPRRFSDTVTSALPCGHRSTVVCCTARPLSSRTSTVARPGRSWSRFWMVMTVRQPSRRS
jgi:hypothetical protein